MRIDLHSHSTVSDGQLSPAELMARAVAKGVDVLALTDHDSVAGLAPAQAAIDANGWPLRLIAGVELSCSWEALEIHVVGLDLDPASPALTRVLEQQTASREARARELGRRLARQRIEGSYEGARALAGNGSLTRAHFARHLVAIGACKSMQKAFDHFIGRGGKAYVPPEWISLGEAVAVIHAAGGQAVLAHPGRYRLSAKWLKRLLTIFKEVGGDAMEVSLPQQSPQERANMGQWCREWGLLASVGSDFHFPSAWQELGKQLWLPKDVTPVWQTFAGLSEPTPFREEL